MRALAPLAPLLLACTITGKETELGDDDDESSDDSTTGDEELWCGISEGPDQPWFELRQGLDELLSGGELEVVCGFQGSFMIELRPRLGGFEPVEKTVPFSVVLDIPGYNVGPTDHFVAGDFNIYIACCDYCYYQGYQQTIQMLLPDAINDPSVLHELPAQLGVSLNTPGGVVDYGPMNVTMWAVDSTCEPWDQSDDDLPPVDGPPIPVVREH